MDIIGMTNLIITRMAINIPINRGIMEKVNGMLIMPMKKVQVIKGVTSIPSSIHSDINKMLNMGKNIP